VPPRGLRPSGLLLLDKPAGPSSFAVVREVRARTGARTGHAGTLDPFASGLLLVLSGSATRLAPWLVGLDKRYVTEIDLRRRTSTGDPEGDVVEESAIPGEEELLARLERLRGKVELPIPAASAVKVGGERAYRLARRGVALEMPLRRSRIEQLDVIAYTGEAVTLDLRVSSGTYVRSVADALGGHCRTLRRTEVGPFRVEDADPERILPPAEALPFLPVREVNAATAAAIRQGRERVTEDVRILHDGELVAVDGTVLPA
jgi:tRNA pseudouridine55 synthase